jgi:hypothetical protein
MINFGTDQVEDLWRSLTSLLHVGRFRDGRSPPPAGGKAGSQPEPPPPLSPVAQAVAEDQVRNFTFSLDF